MAKVRELDSTKYYDCFGQGDTREDILDAIKTHGQPKKIFIEDCGYMAALVYADKVICVGYDGNEYTHSFVLTKRVKVSSSRAS